jgi:pimeloyl-ACP methyl ester carboxylesterase
MVAQSTQSSKAEPQRRSAHVIHYNMSYVVQGAELGTDGAIVLLHDVLGGAFTWDGVMARLSGIGRAIYAFDLLGYGESDHPWQADTSIWGHADCLGILFEHLNLTNIVLVGHGMGGGVAQILATRLRPERVAALILIDSICYDYAFAPNWPLSDMKKYQDPEVSKEVDIKALVADLEATAPNGSYHPDWFKRQIDKYIQPWDDDIDKEVLLQQVRLLIPSYINSVSSDLHTLGKPSLIIWGEKDTQIPLKFAQRLHREIPESRLVIVPDAGHLILFDAPDQVANALADFIGS